MNKIKLLTTEVIDGVKRRVGEEVSLPDGDPILAKTRALAKAERVEGKPVAAANTSDAAMVASQESRRG